MALAPVNIWEQGQGLPENISPGWKSLGIKRSSLFVTGEEENVLYQWRQQMDIWGGENLGKFTYAALTLAFLSAKTHATATEANCCAFTLTKQWTLGL
jgi:hypothetical protein